MHLAQFLYSFCILDQFWDAFDALTLLKRKNSYSSNVFCLKNQKLMDLNKFFDCFVVECSIQQNQKLNKNKKIKQKMTSVENLLTNSTNRFYPTIPTIITSSHSSFTPLATISSDPRSIHSISKSPIPSELLQPFTQTYSQLQEKQKSLTKQLAQANQEKQLMTMLFQKVFLMEAGHEERMKKRFRRRKVQIQAKHACKLCSKIYSSSTSLARHAKLKHSYTMLEPPQHDYQIPPQPNSIIESCDQSKPDDTELNERNEKKSVFMNEDDSEEIDQESSSASYSSISSSSHKSTPFQKGLS